MKTAYELAMERLNKATPTVKLSTGQKKQLAELDSKFAARIAEREITLQGEIAKAAAKGDVAEVEKLERNLADERKSLQAELVEKKERIRQGKA